MPEFTHRKKTIASWNDKLEAIKQKIEEETTCLFSDITNEFLKTKFMAVRFEGRQKEYLFCSSVTHEETPESWKINGVRITLSGEVVCGVMRVEDISGAKNYESIQPEKFFIRLKSLKKTLYGNQTDVAKECLLYERPTLLCDQTVDIPNVVAYCRLSRNGSKNGHERQIAQIGRYCKNKYHVDEWFNETISGGVPLKDREVINKLVRYCKINDIKIIIISELNRLGRTENTIIGGISFLRKNGIEEIHSVAENIVIDKGFIETSHRLLKTLAKRCEDDRNNISYRLSSGWKSYMERIENGEPLPKIGRPEGTRKPLEKYKEQYHEMIDLLEKGVSYRNIHVITGNCVSTIQRVAKLLNLSHKKNIDSHITE